MMSRYSEAISSMASGVSSTSEVLKTLSLLEEANINAEVISLNTLKPLDKETILKSVKKTNKAVVVENHSVIGGAFSSVAEYLSTIYPIIMKPIGVQDEFGQTGKYRELLEVYKLDYNNIAKQIIEFMK